MDSFGVLDLINLREVVQIICPSVIVLDTCDACFAAWHQFCQCIVVMFVPRA